MLRNTGKCKFYRPHWGEGVGLAYLVPQRVLVG